MLKGGFSRRDIQGLIVLFGGVLRRAAQGAGLVGAQVVSMRGEALYHLLLCQQRAFVFGCGVALLVGLPRLFPQGCLAGTGGDQFGVLCLVLRPFGIDFSQTRRLLGGLFKLLVLLLRHLPLRPPRRQILSCQLGVVSRLRVGSAVSRFGVLVLGGGIGGLRLSKLGGVVFAFEVDALLLGFGIRLGGQ